MQPKDGIPQRSRVAANVALQSIHKPSTQSVSGVESRGEKNTLHLRTDQFAHLMQLEIAAELIIGSVHELNQPLTAIAMLVCSAQEIARAAADSGSARQLELLSKIELQTARACEITRRIRQTNRRTDPHRSPCDPNFVIRKVLEQMSAEIRATGADLRLNLDPTVGDALPLDVAQFRLVILNLLRNAIESLEFSAPASRILEVSTKLTENRDLIVDVYDGGLGIGPELESCLFEPFITSKPDHLGLGLTISRSIVEAHKGRLWFECPPTGGTRFLALLPCPPPEGASDGS